MANVEKIKERYPGMVRRLTDPETGKIYPPLKVYEKCHKLAADMSYNHSTWRQLFDVAVALQMEADGITDVVEINPKEKTESQFMMETIMNLKKEIETMKEKREEKEVEKPKPMGRPPGRPKR